MKIPLLQSLVSVGLIVLVAGAAFWIYRASHSVPQIPNTALESATTSPATAVTEPKIEPVLYTYIEVTDGCDPNYVGTCVNMRSGPGTEYPIVERLRTGVVLKVAGTATSTNGQEWYKIDPGTNLRYPERVGSGWYVLADAVQSFKDDGDHHIQPGEQATTTKRILVSLSTETLYAYDGDTLFMEEPISTGLNLTPTPTGTFTVYMKTPSRYMQGPIAGVSDQVYDLPGVPWDLYFTKDGAVIHGAYWHNHFGQPWSHGCVNLSPENAKKLYDWADIGTPVIVKN